MRLHSINFVKFKTFNEFDKLFLNKSEQKLTDFQFLSDWLFLFFAMYLMPLIAFYQFEKPSNNWSLYLGTFGLLFMIISICCFVPVLFTLFKRLTNKNILEPQMGISEYAIKFNLDHPISYLIVTGKIGMFCLL